MTTFRIDYNLATAIRKKTVGNVATLLISLEMLSMVIVNATCQRLSMSQF